MDHKGPLFCCRYRIDKESLIESLKENKVSRREEYEMKTEALITPIVDEKGFELVDVEYVKEGMTTGI